MDHRPLGRTGVSVSQLTLGAMMFGAWGNPDHDESVRIIHRALDAGITVIDTADVYSSASRRRSSARRSRVAATTSSSRRRSPCRWGRTPTGAAPRGGESPARWRTRCAGSAPTGSTSSRPTVSTPTPTSTRRFRPSPTSSALARSARSGASTVTASQLVEAQWMSELRGHERLRTEQPPYSMLTRVIEFDVLPTAQRHGMGVLTYSPLAGGWLSASTARAARSPARAAGRQRVSVRGDAVWTVVAMTASPSAGRPAIVIGGTHGIGLAIAEELIRDGAHVVVTGRDASKARAAKATLGAAGTVIAGDVTDRDHIASPGASGCQERPSL